MIEIINNVLKEVEVFQIENKKDLEQFRLKYIAKNGLLNSLFEDFKKIPAEQKKIIGERLNVLKKTIENKLNEHQKKLESHDQHLNHLKTDYTRSAHTLHLGSRHPLSIIKNQILQIFQKIGFSVAYGPEIEDDWHNFTALNFPENHPAREMQDTFFLSKKS